MCLPSIVDPHQVVPVTATELARLRPLAQFALAVLEESRSELADLDGGWLQDKAEALGLLVRVPVTEPCGDECRCADYGAFPQDCLRYSDEVSVALGRAQP
jgi:hypothetical protein